MFYEKKENPFSQEIVVEETPGLNMYQRFVKKTARKIADGILEKKRTGVPLQKAMNIMNQQLLKVACKQKKRNGYLVMDAIKAEIIDILKRETNEQKTY